MFHWYPTWQQSAVAAGVLVVAGGVLRRRRPGVVATFTWEAGVLLGLFALWQFAGRLSVHARGRAAARGEALWHVERVLHLPSETSVQHLLLPHPLVVRLFNTYYAYAHVNGLLLTLLWLFVWHRNEYARARTALALTTFACLAIQLISVAPPRLLGVDGSGSTHGIIDVATAYGQSVYGPLNQGLSDQFAAMPSVHVAWASAAAWFFWRQARGPLRYLGLVHLTLTVAIVVATGNHYWADGIVAAALLAVALFLTRTRQRPPLPGQREALRVEPGRTPGADQAASTVPSSSLLRSQTGSGSSARSST